MYILVAALLICAAVMQERLIDRAAFMRGCWERRVGHRIVEEHWLNPRGGTMLGMSRTVRSDTLIEYEFLRLYERNGRLVYEAHPSGQKPAEFESTTIERDVVTFANPAHDFPQRIRYARSGDSLFARIEGSVDGRERGVDFRYARVTCE